jgi:hypothetical protein
MKLQQDQSAPINPLLITLTVILAMMKAFIDSFWLLGVIFLAVIPLMFLTKSIQGHKTHVVGH